MSKTTESATELVRITATAVQSQSSSLARGFAATTADLHLHLHLHLQLSMRRSLVDQVETVGRAPIARLLTRHQTTPHPSTATPTRCCATLQYAQCASMRSARTCGRVASNTNRWPSSGRRWRSTHASSGVDPIEAIQALKGDNLVPLEHTMLSVDLPFLC